MTVLGIVPYKGTIIQGVFLGWSAISIKQFSNKKLVTDDVKALAKFEGEEGGEIRLFSRFAFENGEIEVQQEQQSIDRTEIPNSPAYKKDGRWFVGIQIFEEETHLSPGAD